MVGSALTDALLSRGKRERERESKAPKWGYASLARTRIGRRLRYIELYTLASNRASISVIPLNAR